jgi:integrase
MPKLSDDRVPAYSRHRASGQAVVTLDGQDIYLGKFNTAASRDKYNRLIGEWLANGRHRPVPDKEITVIEIIERFKDHAVSYYCSPDGKPTGEWDIYRLVLHQLRLTYGRTPAVDFGPLALKALRNRLISEHEIEDAKTRERRKVPGWSRSFTNRQIGRVKHVFKWAVSEQLIPTEVHQALTAVEGLRMGRTPARETEPVRPVPEATVAKTLRFLSKPLQAIVQIEQLTGARGGEILIMRPCDIDMSRPVWFYRPTAHKTAHKGIAREIPLGERCKAILEPFLASRPTTAFLFSPVESMAEMRAKRVRVKTPPGVGNCAGTNRKAKPLRKPGERYNNRSYAHAIRKAAAKAGVPHWHPHQLRHTAGTNFRREFGLEASRVMLGHTSEDMTASYAERDLSIAEKVAAKVG